MRVITCVFTLHNLWLVALAAVVCVGGGWVALELLRRALYFNTEVNLSLLPEAANWREQALRNMTGHWGWTHDHLRNLDMRDLWKVRRARDEHRSLVRELTGSYRFLQEFAGNNAAEQLISSHEMTVLGRKLFSAFERQPDKVEWINHEIAGELAEKHLSFCYLSMWGMVEAFMR